MTKKLLIQATHLHCYYGKHHALNDISVTLYQGEVLGLLGQNGAGKSTTMQLLTGNLAPARGTIRINSIDLQDQPIEAKRQLGYLPETPPLYRDMRVLEYLRYCARLHDISKANLETAINKVLKRCGLEDMQQRLIGNLSKGYQQRVGIAQAIIHEPAVIILDEPTVGLDPIQIQEIRDLIKKLAQDHSVILSTHILQEVEAVCDRVQIIKKGQTVFVDSLDKLKNYQNNKVTANASLENIFTALVS
ncbi:MAG TPA: ABC transporter ATP-binding protein [Leucothrix mucor]|uniref:ABC transporter ATP-binding protein n=1 Tax=Leucothrix mucor TaxID=45248 RepID=A0A7V2WUH1_LEUMU|nr:ABC transporter ATP-binding protein [Leucothrix mucor]